MVQHNVSGDDKSKECSVCDQEYHGTCPIHSSDCPFAFDEDKEEKESDDLDFEEDDEIGLLDDFEDEEEEDLDGADEKEGEFDASSFGEDDD